MDVEDSYGNRRPPCLCWAGVALGSLLAEQPIVRRYLPSLPRTSFLQVKKVNMPYSHFHNWSFHTHHNRPKGGRHYNSVRNRQRPWRYGLVAALIGAVVWAGLIVTGHQTAPTWMPVPVLPEAASPADTTQAEPISADATGLTTITDPPATAEVPDYDDVERNIGVLTNVEREQHGLPALVWDEWLQRIAREHSRDMGANDYFSHDNLVGDGPTERGLKAEYYCLNGGLGENISIKHENTPERFMEGWMSSPGHRKNILDSMYRRIGVGVHEGYSSKYGHGYFGTMVLC